MCQARRCSCREGRRQGKAYSVGNVLAVEVCKLLESHGGNSIQQLLMHHFQLAEAPYSIAQCLQTAQNTLLK